MVPPKPVPPSFKTSKVTTLHTHLLFLSPPCHQWCHHFSKYGATNTCVINGATITQTCSTTKTRATNAMQWCHHQTTKTWTCALLCNTMSHTLFEFVKTAHVRIWTSDQESFLWTLSSSWYLLWNVDSSHSFWADTIHRKLIWDFVLVLVTSYNLNLILNH